MKEISLPAMAKVTAPNPVSIVCTQRTDGGTNLVTVSWWTYLSYDPNMIVYAMAKTSYSGELVRANKKVVLTIPSAQIVSAVLGCGSTTGRNTNKIEKFGIGIRSVKFATLSVLPVAE